MTREHQELSSIIENFYKVAPQGAALCDMLRRGTALIYFLETYRAEIHKQWIATYHNTEGTNAAKERQADKDHPELYLLRRLIPSANKVIEAMRSNLSYLKTELSQLNTEV
tara:strand:- start:546 stop:878 length:333 start_codon:yes stop_codon:yes gene_type:complete